MRKTRQLILDLSDLAQPALGCLIVCIGGFSGPHAGKLLPEVTIDDKLLETVAKLSVELGVDGHRADITVIKTALTLAAFNGRKQANLDDLKEAAKLVLPHRMRRRPFEESELDWNKVESFLAAEA